MASTYSTNLALELIGTGDQAGTWGNTLNTNIGTLVEQAISGYVTQAVSTGTDTTITMPNGASGVARNMYIELTGTGGTNTNLIVPANKKLYFIYNNSTGAVTVKVSGQTGVSVPAGKKVSLVSNGTDVVDAINYIPSFTTPSFSITNLSVSDTSSTVFRSASATITNLIATNFNANSATITNLKSTNIGAQSGSGTIAFYNDGDQCLITMENGVAVKDADGSTPTINLQNSSGTVVGQIIYSSGLYLQSLVNSSQVVLNGYSSGAVQRSVFVGNPDGPAYLYYAGTTTAYTTADGLSVGTASNLSPTAGGVGLIKLVGNGYTGYATLDANAMYVGHNSAIRNFVLRVNAADMLTIVPAGAISLNYSSANAFFTASQGIGVQSTTGSSTSVAFYSTGSTLEGVAYTQSAGQFTIRAELANRGVTLQGTDSGNADSTLFDAAPDGAATLYYDNTAALATAAIATNGTGATVTDGGGTARPVGLNVTPITTASAGTDLRIANSGHLIRCTSAITVDIDTTTDTAPNGSFWTIENAAGANCTISATGVNLVWLDGSAGTTGSRTFAAYGYVTILKVSNGNYRIVGTGLS